jgi:hypothetical protein
VGCVAAWDCKDPAASPLIPLYAILTYLYVTQIFVQKSFFIFIFFQQLLTDVLRTRIFVKRKCLTLMAKQSIMCAIAFGASPICATRGT